MNYPDINNLSLCEWNHEWRHLGILRQVAHSAPTDVGLYRAKLQGRIVYVGVASEYKNRGLRKRLSDYVRPDNRGRDTTAGQRLNQYADSLEVDVLVTGKDSAAADSARRLEPGFIFLFQPEWNFLPRRRGSATVGWSNLP